MQFWLSSQYPRKVKVKKTFSLQKVLNLKESKAKLLVWSSIYQVLRSKIPTKRFLYKVRFAAFLTCSTMLYGTLVDITHVNNIYSITYCYILRNIFVNFNIRDQHPRCFQRKKTWIRASPGTLEESKTSVPIQLWPRTNHWSAGHVPRLLSQETWITKVRVNFGGSGNFTLSNLNFFRGQKAIDALLRPLVCKLFLLDSYSFDSLTIMNMRSAARLNRPHKSLVNWNT